MSTNLYYAFYVLIKNAIHIQLPKRQFVSICSQLRTVEVTEEFG